MPIRLATLYRGFILALIIGHVMFMYGTARVLAGTVGYHWQATLIGAGFALALVVPLFFAAGLPELPEVLAHRRAERRWKRGFCTKCAYDLEGFVGSHRPRCPECGSVLTAPGAYQFSWQTLQRFALMATLGWALGCIGCESLLLLDEQRFRQQTDMRVEQGMPATWSRPRVWPFHGLLLYHHPDRGVYTAE